MADVGPAGPARLADASVRERLVLAAHDLRSPLNTILAWVQVLEQSVAQPTPPVERALAGIRDGVARQVSMIEQLLELSRHAPEGSGGNGRSP